MTSYEPKNYSQERSDPEISTARQVDYPYQSNDQDMCHEDSVT